jgi:hypothetical protein
MARINWKEKVSNIPAQIHIAPKVVYQVTWQKKILDTKGNSLFGITDLDNKIITIKMGMSPKLTCETFFHECLHAWSEEFKIGLTEPQVLGLEYILPYLDGLFKK